MKITILLVALLAACAAQSTTGSVDQGLCKIDPVTGRCASPIRFTPGNEYSRQTLTRAEAADEYPDATPLDGGCDHGSALGLQTCHVHLSGLPFGYSMVVCDIVWTYTDAPPEQGGGWSVSSINCSVQ